MRERDVGWAFVGFIFSTMIIIAVMLNYLSVPISHGLR